MHFCLYISSVHPLNPWHPSLLIGGTPDTHVLVAVVCVAQQNERKSFALYQCHLAVLCPGEEGEKMNGSPAADGGMVKREKEEGDVLLCEQRGVLSPRQDCATAAWSRCHYRCAASPSAGCDPCSIRLDQRPTRAHTHTGLGGLCCLFLKSILLRCRLEEKKLKEYFSWWVWVMQRDADAPATSLSARGSSIIFISMLLLCHQLCIMKWKKRKQQQLNYFMLLMCYYYIIMVLLHSWLLLFSVYKQPMEIKMFKMLITCFYFITFSFH